VIADKELTDLFHAIIACVTLCGGGSHLLQRVCIHRTHPYKFIAASSN
jgi:hypothetical protein